MTQSDRVHPCVQCVLLDPFDLSSLYFPSRLSDPRIPSDPLDPSDLSVLYIPSHLSDPVSPSVPSSLLAQSEFGVHPTLSVPSVPLHPSVPSVQTALSTPSVLLHPLDPVFLSDLGHLAGRRSLFQRDPEVPSDLDPDSHRPRRYTTRVEGYTTSSLSAIRIINLKRARRRCSIKRGCSSTSLPRGCPCTDIQKDSRWDDIG
jgi:hypothetical protein